jgi:putative ABC transport system ATP-binding protein
MVFQSFNLLPTMTVMENVALPAYILGRPTRAAHEDALGLLRSVGLGNKVNAWPDTLSGGEMQRVALARALINLPDVVLADEPTGNLDRANAAAVMDLLESLTISRGSTLVMVTHSEDAARRAGRIIRMEDGRIAE